MLFDSDEDARGCEKILDKTFLSPGTIRDIVLWIFLKFSSIACPILRALDRHPAPCMAAEVCETPSFHDSM